MGLRFPLAAALFAAASFAQTTAEVVRRACSTIDAFDYGEVIYGRYGDAWHGDGPGLAELAALAARRLPAQDLRTLLRDADPKVRTLALLLLFDREEKELLPHFAELTADDSATFPSASRKSLTELPPNPRDAWTYRPTPLGTVAQGLLDFVYRAADPRYDPAAFDAFWQQHGGPNSNALWLRVRLLRAYGGATPLREAVHARVARVRTAVDALPTPDRELLLLGLPDERFEPATCFATDAERVAAANRLGDEVLLRALAGEFPSNDPGMHSLFCERGVFGTNSTLHRFLLAPQHRIFAAAAAPRLIELETEQRRRAANTTGFVDTGWAIKAASLQAEHAAQWLVAALDRFSEPHAGLSRAQLLAALVQFGDEASEATFVARFWRDDLTFFGKTARGLVLEVLPRVPAAKARRVLAAIVAAPAFADTDALTVIEIGKAVDKLLGKRLIPDGAETSLPPPKPFEPFQTKEQHAEAVERTAALANEWRAAIVAALR